MIEINGLSKAYRVAGYRSGWLVITGPKEHAAGFIEGIDLLASTRLCPNVPAQHAIQVALGGHQSINDLILPGGRLLEQRDVDGCGVEDAPAVEARVQELYGLSTHPTIAGGRLALARVERRARRQRVVERAGEITIALHDFRAQRLHLGVV